MEIIARVIKMRPRLVNTKFRGEAMRNISLYPGRVVCLLPLDCLYVAGSIDETATIERKRNIKKRKINRANGWAAPSVCTVADENHLETFTQNVACIVLQIIISWNFIGIAMGHTQ